MDRRRDRMQIGTYIAQAGVWRRVVDTGGSHLSRSAAYQLSLAKLFADQALPSAGVSSSVKRLKRLSPARTSRGKSAANAERFA